MRYLVRYLSLVVLLLCTSCTVREQKSRSQQPVQCEVLTVQSVASLSTYSYLATVQEQTNIPLSLPYGGTVTEVCVRPNAKVRKGDVLLRVDDTNARQALATARAAFAQAEDAMNRTKPLHEKGLISDVQMVELQTKFNQAQAACVAANRQVQQCVLTAPLNGIAAFDALHVGQHIVPEVPVITLLDLSGFTVLAYVPEAEVAALHTGDSARLDIPALQAVGLQACLIRIGMQANVLTHSYPVEATISNPPAGLLPGMVGTLSIVRTGQSAVVIPQHCITLLPEGPAVWTVGEDSRAERRQITLGAYHASGVEVTAGLHNGDRVVVAGYQKLYHNAVVESK